MKARSKVSAHSENMMIEIDLEFSKIAFDKIM
jgi:hypothetical protein